MLISTKELRIYFQNLKSKIKTEILKKKDERLEEEDETIIDFVLTLILSDMAKWEQHQIQEMGEPPSGLGVDAEKALVVYCGQKLYEFVEKFSVDKEEDINLIAIGKIYLEVKKALREGRFKRV